MPKKISILGICSSGSNAGKTTLITQLISTFADRNIRVSVIKHAHHLFDIDHPGKDSYKIREAGAVQTLIASNKRWALMTETFRVSDNSKLSNQNMANLEELIHQINPNFADLILIEGFKSAPIPKIEVYRENLNTPLLANLDPNIIAVASDVALTLKIPVLNLNDVQEVANFIMKKILKI